jgi:hypothetical protein
MHHGAFTAGAPLALQGVLGVPGWCIAKSAIAVPNPADLEKTRSFHVPSSDRTDISKPLIRARYSARSPLGSNSIACAAYRWANIK